jgi:2'-5' RNA ligase
MGRGEEWWRAKAKEWNDKLENAQKNYDEASQALKAKEQQREDSKFKPHSQRKRLSGEVKALEEKAKEREKELKEVKNTVEKVLPKQAEDDHADPDWLKSKEQGEITPAPGNPPKEPNKP